MPAKSEVAHPLQVRLSILECATVLAAEARSSSACLDTALLSRCYSLLESVLTNGIRKHRSDSDATEYASVLEYLGLKSCIRARQQGSGKLHLEWEAVLRDNVTLRTWISSSLQQKELVSKLDTLVQDKDRSKRYYYNYGLLLCMGDYAKLRNYLQLVQELPIVIGKVRPRSSSLASDRLKSQRSWTHKVIENEHTKLTASFGRLKQDEFQSRGEDGVFKLLSDDDNWKAKANGEDESSRLNDLHLVWIPESHYRTANQPSISYENSLKNADQSEESVADHNKDDLPTGWDRAYDPVTGHEYYIDHENHVTTWEHPDLHKRLRLRTQSSAGSDETEEFDLTCRCKINSDSLQSQKCGVTLELLAKSPTLAVVWSSAEDINAGCIAVSCCLPSGRPGFVTLTVSRGLTSIVRVLRQCNGCRVVATWRDSLASGSFGSQDYIVTSYDEETRIPLWLASMPRKTSDRIELLNNRDTDDDSSDITIHNWCSFLNDDGSISNWNSLRRVIFFRALSPDTRVIAWPYLLHVLSPQSTKEELGTRCAELRMEYNKLKDAWLCQSILESSKLMQILKDVSKDVVRTDRDHPLFSGYGTSNLLVPIDIIVTYCWTHQHVEYCQGMTDYLGILLTVLKDEVMAYWCFCKVMDRVGPFFYQPDKINHTLDILRVLTSSMFPKIFDFLCQHECTGFLFAYRWILLDFRREFGREEVYRLWELFWSGYRCTQHELLVSMAIIEIYSEELLSHKEEIFNVLEFFSQLARKMDFQAVMKSFRAMLYKLQDVDSEMPDTVRNLVFFEDGDKSRPTSETSMLDHVYEEEFQEPLEDSDSLHDAFQPSVAVDNDNDNDNDHDNDNDPHQNPTPQQSTPSNDGTVPKSLCDTSSDSMSEKVLPRKYIGIGIPPISKDLPDSVISPCVHATLLDKSEDYASALAAYMRAIDITLESKKQHPPELRNSFKRTAKNMLLRAFEIKKMFMDLPTA
eukprot:m.83740 g.83740  ORF g.83740 m.83740 type:complete len:972 (-) comp12934_c0_seq1:140-3055(-)